MTPRYMLDTNIVSDVIKFPLGKAGIRVADLPPGSACLSIVVAAELRFGARKAKSDRLWQKITDFMALVPSVPFHYPGDELYAEIRARLESSGTPIGPNDIFIAAHALSLDLTLVTANLREFSRVPGLRLENWLD